MRSNAGLAALSMMAGNLLSSSSETSWPYEPKWPIRGCAPATYFSRTDDVVAQDVSIAAGIGSHSMGTERPRAYGRSFDPQAGIDTHTLLAALIRIIVISRWAMAI